MNPLPTVGLKTLIIFGLSFAKQLAHGLVKRFAGYVTLLNAFVLDKVYPKQWPATVEIKTKKDETFFTRIEYPKGDPENALTWDEIIDKFRGLVSTVYTKDQAEQIIQQIRRIDEEKNLGQCTPMFLSDH